MEAASGFVFLGMESALLSLAVLGIVRIAFLRLESSVGIVRDGLPTGRAAPSWSLPDSMGRPHMTPGNDRWQLLLFTDRSLAGLPELATGIQRLAAASPELEVLLLSRDSKELCAATVEALDLPVPIVPVDQAFYNRFWVRVMPFAFLLNPHGVVRWLGLVNTEAQLFHMWRMAQAIERKDE